MTRAKSVGSTKRKHKKILKLAKGYRGRAKNCYRTAVQRVEKGLQYAYRDRRAKKRDFRSLWVARINAAAREHGLVYSVFIGGLKKANIDVDRKILAELAVNNPDSFAHFVEEAKKALK